MPPMLEPEAPGPHHHPELEEEEEEEPGRGKEPGQGGWQRPELEAPAVEECGGSTLTTLPASR